MDRLWDVFGYVALLVFGLLVVFTARESWRHPERAPAWMTRGPRWAVRCRTAGVVLLGIGMGGSGVYGLTGLPEPWVVGFCRVAGPMIFLLVFRPSVARGKRRRGEGRPPVSGAAEGTAEGGRDDDGQPKRHVA
ncbi:hypothetical protein GTY86_07185 [Streptomyces sp. SID5770]|uniref:hypothetical protein n=1 Tax=unclassified Streptomyces TaxID=2593676 RepID=UPI000EF77993|nr:MULTISPECIES: hypothetical protein [unclassified Streptomyces]MZE51099.1 hypothetical protein [Streptomyces sp. SID5770]